MKANQINNIVKIFCHRCKEELDNVDTHSYLYSDGEKVYIYDGLYCPNCKKLVFYSTREATKTTE